MSAADLLVQKVTSMPSLLPVSIIIATYNFGHLIAQTLGSVQSQTYQNWECVVVDDGSTDDTREIVMRFAESDGRIKYLYQKNQGLSAARNKGIRNSKGKYLQLLDADDMLEVRKIEQHLEYLEQHPEVDIVYGSVRYFSTEKLDERRYSKDDAARPWMSEVSGTGRDILLVMIDDIIMPVNAALIRRSVVEQVGFFDETLNAMEDWDYWRCCAINGVRFQFHNPDGTLALVRDQPLSMSKDKQRMITAFRRVQEKIRASADAETAQIYRRTSAYLEGRIGLWEVSDGKFITGTFHLFKASILARKIKWLVYACVAPLVSTRLFEKIIWLSMSGFVADLRQNLVGRAKGLREESGGEKREQ